MKRKRLLAGLSQHELARRADVKFSRLHYAESRRLRLRVDEVEKVEAALRVALAQRAARIAEEVT